MTRSCAHCLLGAAGTDVELERVRGLADGLALLERRAPDCVLLDVSRANAGGLEVVRRATAIAAGVPVIVLGDHPVELQGDVRRAGAVEFVAN